MSNELKSCPFCGGEARTTQSEGGYISVCTGECEAQTTIWVAEKRAKIAWNQRTISPDFETAHQENRIVVLPAPIGAPVWVIYPEETDVDGSVIPAGVEELHLSGYVNEEGREFYLTYSECDTGCCDVLPDNLFVTREDAEAALKGRG